LPLYTRKQQLRSLIPLGHSWLHYVDHVSGSGSKLFRAVGRRDLEGIVAKWARGT
jgi:ATP-dependent DNA ligase